MPKGDIGSVIETKVIVTNNLRDTYNCIKLSDNYYMMSFKDNDSDGHIVTFSITESDGNIGGTISNWEYLSNDTTQVGKLIKISGTTYAIVYSASQTINEFRVATFTVSDVGVITETFIESLTIPTTNEEPNAILGADIVNISGDIYAIAFIESGAAKPGVVVTVDIDSAGVISNAVLDTLEFASVVEFGLSMVKVADTDYVAIAYSNNLGNPTVVSVSISSAGVIPATVTDTEILSAVTPAKLGNIIRVSGTNYYALSIGLGSSGRIYTCSINSSGTITSVDSDEFDANEAEQPSMVSLGGGTFALAYRGVDNDGFLVTIPISSLGIVGSVIESLEFRTVDIRTPFIIYLGYGNYAITYGYEAGDDVQCVTVGIVTGAVFPSQAITRVTNLIHRYNRKEGIYELEMNLGEVTSDFGLPEWASSPRTLAAKLEKERLESLIAKKVRESLTGSQLWPGEVPPSGGIGPRPIDPE